MNLRAILVIVVGLLACGCATAPPEETGEVVSSLCSGIEQRKAEAIAEDWLTQKFEGHNFAILEWEPLREGELYIMCTDGEYHWVAGCLLQCQLRPIGSLLTEQEDRRFRFLFPGGMMVAAEEVLTFYPAI